MLKMIYPSCSESVFRFHTVKPDEVQKILQYIANEIGSNTDFDAHKNQVVPLYDKVDMYDTNWNGELSYSGKVMESYEDQISSIWKQRDDGVITQEEALEKYEVITKKIDKEIYPKSILKACAGMGDNDAVIKLNKKEGFFTLNIGNNDISPDNTGWVNLIKAMNIQVEEAECDEELREIARDCTCSIIYGFQEDIKQKNI